MNEDIITAEMGKQIDATMDLIDRHVATVKREKREELRRQLCLLVYTCIVQSQKERASQEGEA